MSQRGKTILKTGTFLIIGAFIFMAVNFIAQPVWGSSDSNPVYGIYEEPSDTIETLCIGASHVRSGVNTMQLYEDYGICAYDLSTANQPVLASYYWLKEIYQMQSASLDTVVFDVSMLRRGVKTSNCHKAIDPMKFSLNKIRAVYAYSDSFEDFLNNLFPAFSYHERWKEVTTEDITSSAYEAQTFLRGYHFRTVQWLQDEEDFSQISIPLLYADETEENSDFNDNAVHYFEKIVQFCQDHDLQLVLIKIPTTWSSGDHNAVQELADQYNLDFIDFNLEPYISDLGINVATDFIPGTMGHSLHMNYQGAEKITAYLGPYLIDQCGNRDVRGQEQYAFMDEELADYQRYSSSRKTLLQETDLCHYLTDVLETEEFTIFISVKDDVAASLTEEQRSYFASIGLVELSQLEQGDSYLAVIEEGSVVTEQRQGDLEGALIYENTLSDGTVYFIQSGGTNEEASSIIIGDTEYSENERGFNILLYDKRQQKDVDTVCFDTFEAEETEPRFYLQNEETHLDEHASLESLTGKDRELYLYNRAFENKKSMVLFDQQVGTDIDLLSYLEAFWDNDELKISITASGTMDALLPESVRESLSKLGLTELAQYTGQGSYYAMAHGGDTAVTERISDSLKEMADPTSQGSLTVIVSDSVTDTVIDARTFVSEVDEAREVAN